MSAISRVCPAALGWVLLSTLACRVEPAPTSEPQTTVEPGTTLAPEADVEVSPEPPAERALQVSELFVDPGRFVGQVIELEVRLKWVTGACTRSVPPSCTGQWQLLDASEGKSRVLMLANTGAAVPMVCVEPGGGLGESSPCPAGTVLDSAARYIVHGELREEQEAFELVPSKIERLEPLE